MAEIPPPGSLSEVADAFVDARGVRADSWWSSAAMVNLLAADVRPELARDALADALEMVRETQESPEELFGKPPDWVLGVLAQWREEGRVAVELVDTTSWREVPWLILAMASLSSLVWLPISLIDGPTTTPGFLAAPLGLALMAALVLMTWQRALFRWALPVAIGVTAFVGLACVAAMATTLIQSNSRAFGEPSSWLYLPLAVAYGVAAVVVNRVVDARPDPDVSDGGAGSSDEVWEHQMAGILRSHHAFSETRIREVIGEARAYAAESGTTLAEEFGTPEQQAIQLEPDVARSHRFRFWVWCSLAMTSTIILIDGFSWSQAGLAAIFWSYVISEARVARRHSST